MRILPLALLLGYGTAFAFVALGIGPSAFDDHPGQLARLYHLVREGPAPWAWNGGWWAGYPEMQFYPPGWFYPPAVLSWLSFGTLAPPLAYQLMLWVTYLAPGVTTFLLLRRLLASSWCALPGAFVVLTFAGDAAGGSASGVEGGAHMGMVAARFAWALLPLLALALVRWCDEGGARVPITAIVTLAAIVLTHPSHAPAALAIVAAAARQHPSPARAFAKAGRAVLVALALVAFWLVPLLLRLGESRALAWGALSAGSVTFTPLLLGLAVAGLGRRGRAWSATFGALWMSIVAVGIVRFALEPFGVRALPADRIADGAWMALLVAAGLGAGLLTEMLSRRVRVPAAALLVLVLLVLCSLPSRALTLWPRASEWPSYASVARGLRLSVLWSTIDAAPRGRVLFVRSGAPLVYGTEWYRPHTHVTALTPAAIDRSMIGGTFTHPSPIAALVYRGDAGRGAITQLAERLDGRSLFGRPLESLDAETFERYASRFRISVVVAMEEDAPAFGFLADNPAYRKTAVAPFVVFSTLQSARPPRRIGRGVWEVPVTTVWDGWASTGVTYYPLWTAEIDGKPAPIRRGDYGDMEVQVAPSSRTMTLRYGPAWPELAGVTLSGITLIWLATTPARRRGRSNTA